MILNNFFLFLDARDLEDESYIYIYKKKVFDDYKIQNVTYAVLDDDVCCPGTEYWGLKLVKLVLPNAPFNCPFWKPLGY